MQPLADKPAPPSENRCRKVSGAAIVSKRAREEVWSRSMPNVLIIGYGNRMRTDDAVGAEAADRLAEAYRDDPRVRVMSAHQLMPEMARDICEAEFLLLLDADAGAVPGAITKSVVTAQADECSFTHYCKPAALLFAARSLYGHTPEAVSLTLAAASFELGMELSPTASRRLPDFLEAARQIVLSWQAGIVTKSGHQEISGKR